MGEAAVAFLFVRGRCLDADAGCGLGSRLYVLPLLTQLADLPRELPSTTGGAQWRVPCRRGATGGGCASAIAEEEQEAEGGKGQRHCQPVQRKHSGLLQGFVSTSARRMEDSLSLPSKPSSSARRWASSRW